jgi:uncharacterized protein YqeY
MINFEDKIKECLKNKKSVELKVYRNLKSEILKFKTQKNAPEYTEAQELKIIQKYVKNLEDAKEQYLQASRDDLMSECIEELQVLRELLPEPVNESELIDWITSTAIQRNWTQPENSAKKIAIPKKEMGNFIKELKLAFPTVEGKIISSLVKNNLEQ